MAEFPCNVDQIICDVCKDLPEDYLNVTLVEFCAPCIGADELSCEFCKYIGFSKEQLEVLLKHSEVGHSNKLSIPSGGEKN